MASEDGQKLFVAGLADALTEQVLRELFEATGGAVTDVSLPKDRATGRPRGFGFVTMATAADADTARQALDGSLQAGRPMSVRPFRSDSPRRDVRGPDGPPGPGGPPPGAAAGSDRTIYVGNLPYDANQAELEQLFQGVGAPPLARVHLPIGPDGRPRGFAFVTMASADAAKAAVGALQGGDLKGRKLVVNIAHPRGERPTRDRPMTGGPGGPGMARPAQLEEPRRTFDDARRTFARPGPVVEGEEAKRRDAKKKKRHKGQRRNEDGGEPKKDWRNWDDD